MAFQKREKKTIARNKAARHEYFVDETFEAGLVLTGTEVKSLRERACQITDAFCLIRGQEAYLHGVLIHPYSNGGVWNVDPDRKRKLLLHEREIIKLSRQSEAKGYTIIPLSLYFKDGRVKAEIALARGKREFDKRQALREEQDKREALRAMRYANKRMR